MKAFEWRGKEDRKTFYGDFMGLEGDIVNIYTQSPQRIVVSIHLAPGEWVANYDNTKVPEGEKKVA